MALFDLSLVKSAIANSDALCGEVKIVTIDGPAGSGKTTLANELASELKDVIGVMSIIHMDELYEGWDDALGQKLFDRIEAWILAPIRNGLGPKFLKYDWHQSQFASWSELPLTEIVIIEGVGSGHTSLRPHVSQAIWVEADDNLLLDRVVQRDGEAIRDEMLLWKPKERSYFDLHNVKRAAHIHIRGQ
jgi:Ni2+-binding GTPase involved in maturation of urease and hydrogenase